MPGPMNRTPRGQKPQVEHPFALLARLMHYVFRDYKFHCIAVFLLIFAGVIANVQGTMFTKNLIDDYITPFLLSDNPNFAPLAKAISRVAVFYAIGVISTYTYNRIMVAVTQGTLRNLRNDLFAHMEKLPIRYFDTHSHGDIMSVYTNDIDTLRQMISQSIPQIINSTFTIVSVFVSMLILNIPLTLVTLVMVSLMLICTKKAAGQSGKYFLDQQKNLGAVNGYIEEMMNGQKVVKVFCHEDASIREFHELNEALYTSADRANTFANILGPINAQLGNISYVICAIVGGVLALNGFGGFTLGGLASFLTFNKSFNMPINQVSQQFNAIVMAMAGADRIFRLMDEPVEKDDGYVLLVNAKEENGKLTESTARTGQWAWKHTHQADGSVDYKKLRGDVVFDGVDFGYTDDKIVLHDVKLYAKPGQKIALVGASGGGKTTLANIVTRFFDPQKGRILIGNIDIRDIPKETLMNKISFVFQNSRLIKASILENVRMAKPNATREEIAHALKAAQCLDIIEKLPNGIDTVVGTKGVYLSGGEQQRIAIARAILKNAPILILDEATAFADPDNEVRVQQALSALSKGKTVIMIAHRLSSITDADCIYVMQDGKIAESGTHSGLIKKNGIFTKMWKNYSEAAEWKIAKEVRA